MSAPAALASAEAVAATVGAAWATFLQRETRAQAPHGYVYASGWRACDRRLVLDMTETGPRPDADLAARFRRGADRERDILADLARIGRDADPPFDVVSQQERFELRDRRGRVAIVGKVDARIKIGGISAPVEVKAWAPHTVDRIETFGDLFRSPWTQAGAYQLLGYLYGASERIGMLVLDRAGVPKVLPVDLDAWLDPLDAWLTRAERALDHVAAGTLPGYLDDAAECRRCPWYGAVCNPPLAAAGAVVLDDPELEALLDAREAVAAAGREYDDLDRVVKARLRGVEAGVIGKYAIAGKWGAASRLDLPADVKRQYTTTDPRGRFTLTIAKL